MKDIAIYGAGGFGREMALLVQQINLVHDAWNLIGFFDDGVVAGKVIDGLPVLGGLAEINKFESALDLVIGIADPATRKEMIQNILNKKIHFPTLIHPNAVTGATTNFIGKGSILQVGAIMTTGIQVDEFSIVQGCTTIGHDVRIGKFVVIMPGCSISGSVNVGDGTMIGTGARILQNLSIGKNCKIGAGAVVTKSIGDNVTALGVPAHEQ